jgi:hypothetical protein
MAMKIQSAKVGDVPGCAEDVGLFMGVKPVERWKGQGIPLEYLGQLNDIRKNSEFHELLTKLKISSVSEISG